jgi:hypothetical protein
VAALRGTQGSHQICKGEDGRKASGGRHPALIVPRCCGSPEVTARFARISFSRPRGLPFFTRHALTLRPSRATLQWWLRGALVSSSPDGARRKNTDLCRCFFTKPVLTLGREMSKFTNLIVKRGSPVGAHSPTSPRPGGSFCAGSCKNGLNQAVFVRCLPASAISPSLVWSAFFAVVFRCHGFPVH